MVCRVLPFEITGGTVTTCSVDAAFGQASFSIDGGKHQGTENGDKEETMTVFSDEM